MNKNTTMKTKRIETTEATRDAALKNLPEDMRKYFIQGCAEGRLKVSGMFSKEIPLPEMNQNGDLKRWAREMGVAYGWNNYLNAQDPTMYANQLYFELAKPRVMDCVLSIKELRKMMKEAKAESKADYDGKVKGMSCTVFKFETTKLCCDMVFKVR